MIYIVFVKGIPIAYVLMSRKTQVAYDAVFKLIKEKVAPDFEPEISITDFELGLMNSVKLLFASIKIQGCWFHFVYVSFFYINNIISFEYRK